MRPFKIQIQQLQKKGYIPDDLNKLKSEVVIEKKALIVFYSRTGNTRRVAHELAASLKCDIQEIKSSYSYPHGFWGFQKALFHTAFKIKTPIQIDLNNLTKYDVVIVGSPVWGSSVSAPVRSFLQSYGAQIKEFAFFTTQGGTFGREQLTNQARQLCGKDASAILTISEPELKLEGYKRKVAAFINDLGFTQVQAATPKRPPEKTASL